MGNGIAHLFAQHGWSVALIDTAPEALEKATATIRTNLERGHIQWPAFQERRHLGFKSRAIAHQLDRINVPLRPIGNEHGVL